MKIAIATDQGRVTDEIGVNVIISGGMGGGAVDLFYEKAIEVVIGAKGSTDEVIKHYIEGELKSSGSICKDHVNSDTCGH